VPSSAIAGSVDLMLFAGDSLLSRTAIPKPGVSAARAIDDCTGTETSEFVANDTRLVLRADLTCARGIKRVETGLMSIAPTGEWMQLQHQEVAGKAATTVARLRYDADQTTKLAELKGVPASSGALRIAVGGTVTTNQVLAVANAVPVSLAEAYVAELGLQFKMNGKALAQLADAGMPSRVIDVMVAMANPGTFQVGAARAMPADGSVSVGSPVISSAMREPGTRVGRCSTLDDFCYGDRGMGAWGFGWGYGYGLDPWGPGYGARYGLRGAYGLYGAYPYGLGYGYGYGYGRWWPGYYYGYTPVVIVNRPTPGTGGDTGGGYSPQSRGRAVNGGGYTRNAGGTTGATGVSRTTSPSSGSSTSTGAGGGAAAGASGGGDGGAARTAKPRGGGL
jgi:hypothetical protein